MNQVSLRLHEPIISPISPGSVFNVYQFSSEALVLVPVLVSRLPAGQRSSLLTVSLCLPLVVELVYWRDVKTTGVVFGAALLLLLSLSVCSIVSVCSYIGLALLSVTICFRIYRGILQAIQKSDEGHPFK